MAAVTEKRDGEEGLPERYLAWELYGAGFENVGKAGAPIELPLRPPADNEVLLRVDAIGLCLSDIKIIKLGGEHPRLRGRDLLNDPTVLGHECAATVVRAGANWRDRFKPGERYIVQADIYYKGEGYAFGYAIRGGLAQYCYLDERALDGDEGCYLLPVRPATGYSQSALSEPWACVEMSYANLDRMTPKSGAARVELDGNSAAIPPLPDSIQDAIIRNTTPELMSAVAPRIAKNGNVYLLGPPLRDGDVTLDIGRMHYEGVRVFGGATSLEALAQSNARSDLLPGGLALFIGGGGPMGQMHVQRAVERANGPRRVVVTDLDQGRMDHIERRFGALAKERGVELITLTPGGCGGDAGMLARIRELASPVHPSTPSGRTGEASSPGVGGPSSLAQERRLEIGATVQAGSPRNDVVEAQAGSPRYDVVEAQAGSPRYDGYDDVVILVPVAGLVTQYMPLAADHAVVNVFAGVAIGQTAKVRLGDLCRGIKIIGTSGSRIEDLRTILEHVEAGTLNTNLSVAAIGGLRAAKQGLEGLRDARFPGKTVIYPQMPDLPLMSIEDVPKHLPDVAKKLGPSGEWTIEAEKALFARG